MHQITLTVSQNVLVNHINEHSCQSICSKYPPSACTHDSKWSRQHRWRCGQSQNKFAWSVFEGHLCNESCFMHTFLYNTTI